MYVPEEAVVLAGRETGASCDNGRLRSASGIILTFSGGCNTLPPAKYHQ